MIETYFNHQGAKLMQMSVNITVTGGWIAFLSLPLYAETELSLIQKRLSDKVWVVWTCDYMQSIATVTLAAEKGNVVIEASLIRTHDVRIRKAIEQEFGSSDIKYLINTHCHHDHTAGNQVYADATIIGHKNVPDGVRGELTGEGLNKLADKFKGMQKDCEEALKHLETGSRNYKYTEEFISCVKLAIPELQNGFVPASPSILFEKNMILDLGDMTVELYTIRGMHTDSDIAIFVPEEGLVAIGDVAQDQMQPFV